LVALDRLDHAVLAILIMITPIALYLLWEYEYTYLFYGSLFILVVAVVFWLLMFFSLYRQVTVFDVKNGRIRLEARIFGIISKDIAIPLETSRLLGERKRDQALLYLIDSDKNRYLIGFFWTSKRYDKYLNEILEYVPIDHEKKLLTSACRRTSVS